MDCTGCESVCCYDGVSLTFDEVVKIKLFVEENNEYFSFLPGEYIKGNRTVTRSQIYNDDFPGHLTKTRCIFGLENGACSLQALAIDLGLHPWEIKPEPCWLFPLRVESDKLIFPFSRNSSEYDDFMRCFPCGKKKSRKKWKELLKNEVEYFSKSLVK